MTNETTTTVTQADMDAARKAWRSAYDAYMDWYTAKDEATSIRLIAEAFARHRLADGMTDCLKRVPSQQTGARAMSIEPTQADIMRSLDRAIDRIMGIEIEAMGGDNLAVTLCSHFDCDDGSELCDNGWSETATNAYDEIKQEIAGLFVPVREAIAAWNAITALAERDARIASLRAEIERLTEREAQAKLDGVRAGETYATKADSDGDDGA